MLLQQIHLAPLILKPPLQVRSILIRRLGLELIQQVQLCAQQLVDQQVALHLPIRRVLQHQHITQSHPVRSRGSQTRIVRVVIHDVDQRVVARIQDVRHLELVMTHLVATHPKPGKVFPLHEYARNVITTKFSPKSRQLFQRSWCMRKLNAWQSVQLGLKVMRCQVLYWHKR